MTFVLRFKQLVQIVDFSFLTAMSSPASVQMEDVRRRSQSLLALSGSAQDVKADVQTMASIPLPLSEKYLHLGAETMLRENTASSTRQEVKISFSERSVLLVPLLEQIFPEISQQ